MSRKEYISYNIPACSDFVTTASLTHKNPQRCKSFMACVESESCKDWLRGLKMFLKKILFMTWNLYLQEQYYKNDSSRSCCFVVVELECLDKQTKAFPCN